MNIVNYSIKIEKKNYKLLRYLIYIKIKMLEILFISEKYLVSIKIQDFKLYNKLIIKLYLNGNLLKHY